MPRRSGVPHRDVLPDPKFGSKVVAKLTNQVMQDGKKGTAQSIVYEAFDIIKEKLGADPMDVLPRLWKTLCPCSKPKPAESAVRPIRFPSRSDRNVDKRLQ